MSTQDYRDLIVLFLHLAWCGYGMRVEFPIVSVLEDKGEGFVKKKKRELLNVQIDAMKRIFPMYRNLMSRDQIEVSTTPYHHPILPLLVDPECMQRCMPHALATLAISISGGCALPRVGGRTVY